MHDTFRICVALAVIVYLLLYKSVPHAYLFALQCVDNVDHTCSLPEPVYGSGSYYSLIICLCNEDYLA
jgi:hypothetical protein